MLLKAKGRYNTSRRTLRGQCIWATACSRTTRQSVCGPVPLVDRMIVVHATRTAPRRGPVRRYPGHRQRRQRAHPSPQLGHIRTSASGRELTSSSRPRSSRIHLRHCCRRVGLVLVGHWCSGTGSGSVGATPHLIPSLADACLRGKPVSKLQTTGMVARGFDDVASADSLSQGHDDPLRSAHVGHAPDVGGAHSRVAGATQANGGVS